jgi:predicted MPP superfamily phosphohydrolase
VKLLRWVALFFLLGLAVIGYAFSEARRDPRMRTATIALAALPDGGPPIRVALISDTHLAGPDNSPERLQRLTTAVNAQHPDLVLLAGDFIGEAKLFGRTYSRAQSVASFGQLKAPLGTVAVLGNHDYWNHPERVAADLTAAGVTVLRNEAVRRGALAIGGIDDDYTGHAKVSQTVRATLGIGGAPIFVSHSPDLFPSLPSGAFLMAGHTHCGQIAVPLIERWYIPSRFGERYRCGRYQEQGRVMIVSGGISTSVVPLRLFAPPEWWLITFTPPGRSAG